MVLSLINEMYPIKLCDVTLNYDIINWVKFKILDRISISEKNRIVAIYTSVDATCI